MSQAGDHATGSIEIKRNDEARRYEVTVDGEAAGYTEFRAHAGRLIFRHTVVDHAFGGRGLGSRLAKFVLDDAVARGETIVPLCPFIAAYLKRHLDAYGASVSWPENG